jgi:GNAT superfamily N-acetyltransferase
MTGSTQAPALDADGHPGVGLARYVRSRGDPTLAEAAVAVLDAYQQRGIATALLQRLAVEVRRHGISTFTASILWENRKLLDELRVLGAEVLPSELGIAAVRIAAPDIDLVAAPKSQLRGVSGVFAARVDEMIGLRFHQ